MGVHGLWELLAPVGRRVSVETLAGKKLAIDASIWMIQFMKAMRDEKGEMVRNAHILGFFRRICKLLYLRTKPVFVFDGGTPALKRRTVIARRRQRENAQAKIRKTAEKLLLNQLKTMRLKELAANLEKQRQEGDPKGKRPIIEESCNVQETQKGNTDASICYNQEKLDEMLAASIAAEENEGFNIAASSGADVPNDEDFDEDDDEEMILPEMHGKVDPAVLASLPPSMQLDLLVQMRERLMAENRQKYQKVKKVPARFSELQIEAYLKTVAFRREIDGVQKSAAGRGIGGVQTSRIASEANREFIFSSSFTGDKQALASVGQERKEDDQVEAPPANSLAKAPPANSPAKAPLANSPAKAPPANSSTDAVNKIQWPKRSDATAGPTVTDIGKAHDEVETYVDERGRLRVSRVRALGIRMTRDLQRNLDLMKEIDQEKNNEFATASELEGVLDDSSGRIQLQEATDKNSDGINNEVDETEEPAFVSGASIEISFEDTSEHQGYDDNDDKIFACLVAGEPVDFSADNSATAKEPLHSASVNEGVEGFVDGKNTEYLHEEGMSDEEEVEWEEGIQDIQLKMSSFTDESQKTVTKGAMEEEAAFQEAVIRSLEDNSGVRDDLNENHTSERAKETVSYEGEVEWEEGFEDIRLRACLDKSIETVTKGALEEEAAFQEAIRRSLEDTSGSMDNIHEKCTSERTREMVDDEEEVEWEEDFKGVELKSSSCPIKNQDTVAKGALEEEAVFQDAVRNSLKDTGGSVDDFHENNTSERAREAVNEGTDCVSIREGKEQPNVETTFSNDIRQSLDDRLLSSDSADAHMLQAELGGHSVTDVDGLIKDKIDANVLREEDEATRNNNNEQEIVDDRLEEEMLYLDKEREELGSEQRKHERDAESVSSEMFAECQELLQMFGLPYIIAPMEAEAQCAFMELSNLVDGVVTDDSDAFLFGAQSVYKNIFDDRKYVETYLMKDIENEIGLDREKLIRMALLLGSDYTEGISGIGIVNAIEVVNAFPGEDGLCEFREWIESPDPSIFGKLNVETGGNSRKKGSKGMSDSNSNGDGISCDQNVPLPVNDDAQWRKQVFMDKHRNVSKNWHISTSFPSGAVISAYASPQVDKSTESFSWGKPDLFVLRRLCWEKFGWGASKSDELLVPVLKEYNKHETQLRLEAFYTFNERFAKIRSKRIEKAVKGITGSKSSALVDGMPQQSGSGRKRKAKPCEDEAKVDTMEKPAVKQQSKRGRTKVKNSKTNLEQSGDDSNVRGRRRGGRGRGGRGKRKATSYADDEISIDDGSSSENDEQAQHISEDAHQIRRSGRVRKSVNYAVSDDEKNENETIVEQVGTSRESVMNQEDGDIDKHVRDQLRVGGETGMEDGLLVKETTNKMDTNMVEDDQIDDTSDQGQASKEYLQFGGGFCLNEDEDKESKEHASGDMVPEKCDAFTSEEYRENSILVNELNMQDQIDDPSDQGQASKEYLQFGGGFCLNEDKDKESNEHASGDTVPVKCDVFTNRENSTLVNELNMNDQSSGASFSLDDDHDPIFLRAMPNLRRKRKN
ncbi:hypothetical protein ACS0TY_028897 [Phlomoides rotata]